MPNAARPLSPHLQVYRWQVQMVTSILHRSTGVILFGGSLLIAAGLILLANGEAEWNQLRECAGSLLGRIFLIGWTWAFSYHLLNGIRHLIQDTGRGYAIASFVRSSWFSIVGSALLTALIWAIALTRGGAA